MTKKKLSVQVRRAYDAPERNDGTRVLVDRLWPRGLAKAKADIDEWCREVAPSTELRTWWCHDPTRFRGFTRRYRAELRQAVRSGALAHLRDLRAGICGRSLSIRHSPSSAAATRSVGGEVEAASSAVSSRPWKC